MAPTMPVDFEALFFASPGAYLVLAPDAPRYTIVAVNDAYLEATGTTRGGMLGRGLLEGFREAGHDPDGTRERDLRASLEQVLRGRAPHAMSVEKDRECSYARLSRPVLDERGAVRYILHHIRDASEEQRAEAGVDLRSQLLANVSHELRTPLTLILGPLERLLRAADLPADARAAIEVAERNGRILLKHVNDLLDLSKLEAGKLRLEYVDSDVARLMRLDVSSFEALAAERGVELRVEAASRLPAQVDPNKLQRVLFNLLSNALKFTPAGGRVRCTLREDAAGDRLVLEVADSGPGIPPDQREAVFERFLQLEDGGRGRAGGTGLGLAIARDLVRLHRGTISIDRAPEGGALVTVSVPRRAPPGAGVVSTPRTRTAEVDEAARAAVAELSLAGTREAGGAAPPLAGDGRPLVLVVEDNRDMNRFICDSLAGEYRTAAAHDGREGFDKALALRPALVVTDLMMPEMSGEQLVRALREHLPTSTVPVVLLTAKADDALRVRLLREGAQDYVMKPFSVDELRARIANLIGIDRLAVRVHAAAAEWQLTPRQEQVLLLLCRGQSNAGIAEALGISLRTVELHVSAILDRADCDRRAALVADLLA